MAAPTQTEKDRGLSAAYSASDLPATPGDANREFHSFQSGTQSVYGFFYRGIDNSVRIFDLPVAPQEIEMDEPASTAVIPTLGAGKFVERRGSIFKTIRVSGTFGYKAQLKVNSDGSEDAGSFAFARFHKLRQFFRDYQKQFTESGSNHEASYMVWTNTKDNENFVVEPMSFRLQRQRAFLYKYSIELRVLGVFKQTPPEKAVPKQQTQDEYNAALQAAIAKAVKEELDKLKAEVAAPAAPAAPGAAPAGNGSLPNGASGTPTSSWMGALSAKASSFQALISNNVGNVTSVVLTPVNEFNNACVSCLSVVSGAYGALFSVADSALNTLFGAVSALRLGTRIVTGEDLKAEWQLLVGHASLVGDAGKELLASWGVDPKSLPGGAEPYSADNQSLTGQTTYELSGGRTEAVSTDAAVAGDPYSTDSQAIVNQQTYLPSENITGTRQETLLAGETGEAFAARVVGDARSWPLIALLNKLKPPYFSNGLERLPNTVRPGDVLVIPVFGGASSGNNVVSPSIPPAIVFTVQVAAYNGSTNAITVAGVTGWRDGQWVGYKIVTPDDEVRVVESGANYLKLAAPLSVTPVAGDFLEVHSLTPQSSEYASSVSILSRLMGQDLKLQRAVPVDTVTESLTDLSLTESGDVKLVSGQDNFVQAIAIKLKSRYGDLPLHTSGSTSFGLSPEIGRTASGSTLFRLSVNLRNTLESDPRVDAVRNVRAVVNRDVLNLGFDVRPVGSSLFQNINGSLAQR